LDLIKHVSAHVFFNWLGVVRAGLEGKHCPFLAHKPRSEQADNPNMRTNIIEDRARLQVLGERCWIGGSYFPLA